MWWVRGFYSKLIFKYSTEATQIDTISHRQTVNFFRELLVNFNRLWCLSYGENYRFSNINTREWRKILPQSIFIKRIYWARISKKGLASNLLSAVIEHSKKHVEQILLTVAEDNKPAIHLYRKFGFENYGIEKKYWKITGNILTKFWWNDSWFSVLWGRSSFL